MSHPPLYLGDGVYAVYNEYNQISLRTGNHDLKLCDNEVILEPEVAVSLVQYIKRVWPNAKI